MPSYTVLCEDLQGFVFIRRALIAAGVPNYQIFKRPFPDSRYNAQGGGSPRAVEGYTVYACGSQHVRMNYPGELARVRAQARRRLALVVHVDVDNSTAAGRTVADRKQELTNECTSQQVSPCTASDLVAHLIARREVETWIHFLSGNQVDEHTQYPKLTNREAECQPAAQAFAQHARNGTIPTGAPPSLTSGIAEFARVL